ncbi:hypothetical protein OS493_025815 [Desmophyllum pertusum]|uniref:Uncharacterized protein n=1 Tax=Desmophyllum pertusum TaxID=174260 RepID=A0A9W9ZAT2_9CNID|nr:hypothetical protein OS493_025815 [Desmophyllum pertusum]
MAALEELSEFQRSNLTNRGLPFQAMDEPEMTMMEAIPYFADDAVNEAKLQGIHPFEFQSHKQMKWTINQMTLHIWRQRELVATSRRTETNRKKCSQNPLQDSLLCQQ